MKIKTKIQNGEDSYTQFKVNIYPDQEILYKTNRKDLNIELFYQFLANEDSDIYEELNSGDLNLEPILNN